MKNVLKDIEPKKVFEYSVYNRRRNNDEWSKECR